MKNKENDYRQIIDQTIEQIFIDEKEVNAEVKKQYRAILKKHDLVTQAIAVRKLNGLSQKQLGEIVGVTQQEISRFESNEHTPTLQTFIQILDGLGCNLKIEKKPEDI